MNHKRHTRDMQGKLFELPNGNSVEVLSAKMEFADSQIPSMKETFGKEYIPFGLDNNYPEYLKMLYDKSAKHNAIINGKVVYIAGNGLETKDERGQVFLEKANEGQTWDQLSKQLALDIENFGGAYVQCIPKLAGGYNYYHISYTKLRTNEDNSLFFYRKDWDKTWRGEQQTEEYPAFYPGIKETSIYFFKEYRCGKDPYPLPSWVACCNWIESDVEISKHTLTNAMTGFSASKMITFVNGEPTDEYKKKAIERRLINAFTGSEGKKIMVTYVNGVDKKPIIDDLGESDLTKEDFTNIDNLITNNIFSGHNITHPLLFGIQQEGKLGSATELKTAYEIFKNTYVNYKQQQLCDIVKYFSQVAGVDADYHIRPVEPLGIELDPVNFKELLPKNWILEKLGIDAAKYEAEVLPTGTMANETMVKLTGRQQQQLLRIVRLFSQGKMTQQQAAVQLGGYGFTTEQIHQYLGINQQFSDDAIDEELLAETFLEFGNDRKDFEVLKSEVYTGEESLRLEMKIMEDLGKNEQSIIELLKLQPKIEVAQVAEALKLFPSQVQEIIDRLTKDKVISYAKDGWKIDLQVPKKTLPEIVVMYSYEKRPDVSGPTLIPTSRPFCQKMVKLSETRLFSRQDIQKISERLGYSVFLRAGGFWNNNGTIEYHCRHGWMKHVVIKKK